MVGIKTKSWPAVHTHSPVFQGSFAAGLLSRKGSFAGNALAGGSQTRKASRAGLLSRKGSFAAVSTFSRMGSFAFPGLDSRTTTWEEDEEEDDESPVFAHNQELTEKFESEGVRVIQRKASQINVNICCI